MSKKYYDITIINFLILLLLIAVLIFLKQLPPQPGSDSSDSRSLQESMPSLNGSYSGQVALEGVYTGTYSDTAAVPIAFDLGTIPLGFHLTQADNLVTGFVDLESSIVFTVEHTALLAVMDPMDGLDSQTFVDQAVGPAVSGIFDGQSLSLESQSFIWGASDEQILEDGRVIPARNIVRQFRLETTEIVDNGAVMIGQYMETLWGFSANPATVVGRFTLERPVLIAIPTTVPTVEPTDFLFLPIMRR